MLCDLSKVSADSLKIKTNKFTRKPSTNSKCLCGALVNY